MSNLPKMSARAATALSVLGDGGQFVERLERNTFTRREQWETRLLDSSRNVVSGIGRAAFRELNALGLLFTADWFSAAVYYGLKNGRAERVAALRFAARGPAEGFEYAGWEGHAAAAQAELDKLIA